MREETSRWIFMKIFLDNFNKQEFQNFNPLSTMQISQGRPILSKAHQLINTPFLAREGVYVMDFFGWRVSFSVSATQAPILPQAKY